MSAKVGSVEGMAVDTSSRITWDTEGVSGSLPERCTCGAILPEDARFCHKCGKPQREEPLIPQEAAEPQPPPPPPPLPTLEPPRIGFHNAPAVRIALIPR